MGSGSDTLDPGSIKLNFTPSPRTSNKIDDSNSACAGMLPGEEDETDHTHGSLNLPINEQGTKASRVEAQSVAAPKPPLGPHSHAAQVPMPKRTDKGSQADHSKGRFLEERRQHRKEPGPVSIGSSANAEQMQELRKELAELREVTRSQQEQIRALSKASGEFQQEAKKAINLLFDGVQFEGKM